MFIQKEKQSHDKGAWVQVKAEDTIIIVVSHEQANIYYRQFNFNNFSESSYKAAN